MQLKDPQQAVEVPEPIDATSKNSPQLAAALFVGDRVTSGGHE